MRLAAAVSLFLLSQPAAAAEGARAPVAVELARATLPRETWDQVTTAMNGQMDQMGEQMLRQSGLADADLEDAKGLMRSAMRDMAGAVLPTYEEMVDFQAGLLAKHWSTAELRELAAFYRSPVGMKSIRIMPEVMKDAMGWMQARVQQRMPVLMEKMKAEAQAVAERRAARAAEGAQQ